MADQKSWTELLEESLPKGSLHMRDRLRDWHVNVDERAKRIADNLGKFAEIKDGKLLDFGCGEGGIAVYFAKQGLESWGVDISGDQLFRTMLRAKENGVAIKTVKLDSKRVWPENYRMLNLILSFARM